MPFLFNAFAVAHPIPEAPPVTIAILFFLVILIFSSSFNFSKIM